MKLIKWISVTDRYNKIHLDRMLAPFGLNSSQHMYVLRICEVPGITQDQFNSLFYINPSNITRSVAALEKMGYLERRPNEKDKRTCCLYPTEKARAAYQPLRQICEDWNRRITGGLTEEERAQFMRLLEKVGEAAVEQNRLELEELNSAKEEYINDAKTGTGGKSSGL